MNPTETRKPLHQAAERPPSVIRKGGRVIVEAWLIEAEECVSLGYQSVHGRACPDAVSGRELADTIPEPTDPTEASIWRQARTTRQTYRGQPSVHFRVTTAKEGRFVWASSRSGADMGAAVTLAFQIAQGADYFLDVAVAEKKSAGAIIDAIADGDWTVRRCARCAARCLIPAATELCPSCADQKEDASA